MRVSRVEGRGGHGRAGGTRGQLAGGEGSVGGGAVVQPGEGRQDEQDEQPPGVRQVWEGVGERAHPTASRRAGAAAGGRGRNISSSSPAIEPAAVMRCRPLSAPTSRRANLTKSPARSSPIGRLPPGW